MELIQKGEWNYLVFVLAAMVSSAKKKLWTLILFRRNVERWLEDDEKGVYDEAFQWPGEKQRRTFRMPGGGSKVADVQLENHLLGVMRDCDTANLQILSDLLIIEGVMFRPNWCGGGADPLFSRRATNFIFRFRQRIPKFGGHQQQWPRRICLVNTRNGKH